MKIMKIIRAICVLIIMIVSIQARSEGADGAYLLEHCRHYLIYLNTGDESYIVKHPHSIGYCQGYVDSLRSITSQIQDSLTGDLFKACIPLNARNDQIARVLTNYLMNRPDLLHWNSGTVALMSVMDAFPCKK